MAYTVTTDTGNHVNIGTKLAALLNGASIPTLHGCGILKVGSDFYLAWIAYE